MSIQYAGGTNINATFVGTTRQDIMSNVLAQLVLAGWTNQSNATAASTGPGKVATFTITIATPGVVTITGHGFLGGERVVLQTTGALPTGLAVNTVYFVKYVDANTFNLSTTSGGSNINTTGSQSGVHTLNTESILVQSATTSQSLAIRIRLKDNRGSCVQVSLESTDGTLLGSSDSTHGGNLLPAALKTFRVVASRYQFFVFVPGVTSVARNFVAAGVPYIPSPNTVPANAGWLHCDSVSDSSSTIANCWRTGLTITANNQPNFQLMWGLVLWENSNNFQNTNNVGAALQFLCALPAILASTGGSLSSGNPALYRWASGDIISSDTLLSWGASALTDEPLVRAQLWDTLIIHDSILLDATTSFDSHNWYNLTSSNVGTVAQAIRGSLMLVVP